MLDNLDYDGAVSRVAEVDGASQASKVVVLNIGKALSEGTIIKQYQGEEAEKRIDAVSMLVPYNPEETKATKHAPEAQPKAGGAMFGRFGRQKPSQQQMQQQQPQPPHAQSGSAARQTRESPGPLDTYAENASKELKSILPMKPKQEDTQNVSASEMVMPTLSLPDQIAELDRIENGLDGNTFNNEQLKLISMEIGALKASLAKEKEIKTDSNLVAIRDQKLKAVDERLAQAKVE